MQKTFTGHLGKEKKNKTKKKTPDRNKVNKQNKIKSRKDFFLAS